MEGLTVSHSDSRNHLLLALCGAAALAGLGEIVLGRLAAPGLAFDGDRGALVQLGTAAEWAGGRAAAASAVLVLIAVVLVCAKLAGRSWLVAGIIAIGAGSSAVLATTGAVAGNVGLAAAVLALLFVALRYASWPAAVAAVVLFARQAPLAADAISSPLGASQLSGVTAVGELALLLVAPVVAIGLTKQAKPSRTEWGIACFVASVATIVLVFSATRFPMIAFSSLEMTMTLPLPLYVLAACSVGFVVTREVLGDGPPARSIALALLMVAAVQPLALHHAIAGLIAVSLLLDTTLAATGEDAAVGAPVRHSKSEETAHVAARTESRGEAHGQT